MHQLLNQLRNQLLHTISRKAHILRNFGDCLWRILDRHWILVVSMFFLQKNSNVLIISCVMQINCLIPKSFSPFYSLIPKSWAETHGLRWHCVG